jgi:hypothetical protein
MIINLVAALWEKTDFGGVKRTLITSAPNLDDIAFNDRTHSIGIHPGPNFLADSTTDTVSFFEDAFNSGTEIVLRTGSYKDITELGVSISSVRFNGPDTRKSGLYRDGQLEFELGPSGGAATIDPIPIVVDLYRNVISNFDWSIGTPAPNDENAQHLTLVQPSTNLPRDFGDEWNDATNALIVRRGPNFRLGSMARLYIDVQPDNALPGGGIETGGWHDFPPGAYLDLSAINFAPGTSAVGFVPGYPAGAVLSAIFETVRTLLLGGGTSGM